MDIEGYGYEEHQALIDRLLDDLRTLSPSGIERVAGGYERYASGDAHPIFQAAEKAALHEVEQDDLGPRWDQLRNQLRRLTEGEGSLVSWKVEHGELGHRAERAAYAAVLGLLAMQRLPREQFLQLIRPMSEALPWLTALAGEA
jgi:hypothetical protein